MRFVKIVAISLLGLLAALLLAVVAVVILVDPNDFKEEISQVVKKHTGRDLVLRGDLGLSFFPWLALTVREAELGNAPGFGAEPFAAIKEADVGVRLMPLLRKELQIGRVRLDGLLVNLQVDAAGKSNWEDLGGKDAADAEDEEADAGAPDASIAGLRVENSTLLYRNAQEGSETRISNLELQTGRLEPGAPAEVRLAFEYSGGEDSPVLPVELQIPALQLDLEKQLLQAPEFTLSVAPLRVRGELRGEKILDAPAFDGRIAVEKVSLRALFEALKMPAPNTRDANVLQSLALEAAVAATSERLNLSELNLQLDDTQMTGTLGVADFATKALRFDLTVDRIDLDRYLPPAEESDQQAAAAAASEPVELPVDLLKELNAKGSLSIGELTVSGMKLSAVKLSVDAADGQVRIDPSQAQLYGGTHRGKVTVDARGRTPRIAFEEQLTGIDLAPLMKDLLDSDLLSGKGTISAALTASGGSSTAWVKTLGGNLKFAAEKGALEGMDLWYEIRRAQALFKRQAAPAEGSTGRTSFNALTASATVKDGTLSNRDLNLDAQYLKTTGQGTVALPTKAVDYQLQTTVYQVPAEGAGAELQDLKSVQIPVRITGTLDDLKVRPDLKARIKAEAEKKIEEKKDELKDKLKKKLDRFLGGD